MQNRTFDPGVLKVVFAPDLFWDRGARCFVVRLYVLERLGKTATFFLRIDASGFNAVRISVDRWFFAARGRFENAMSDKVMPSRAARGYRRDERRSRRQ